MAEALGPSHHYEAALVRMDHAGELSGLCSDIYPSAGLYRHAGPRKAMGSPGAATWADFLGDLGFAFPERLQLQFDWWVEVLRTRRIDLVIADFAPISMLAARALGIPSVCVGTGYSTPPPGMASFPILLPEYTTLVHDEADLLANTNAVLSRLAGQPLEAFSEVYRATVSLPRTIPLLDPYNGLRSARPLPPLNNALSVGADGGDEIFVYFSTAETAHEPVVEALCGINLPMRAYLPGAEAALLARLAQSGVAVETAPLSVEQIASRSRLTLNAGQHGSLCVALALGIPQLSFPQHLEHLYHARRARDLGVAEIVPHRSWGAEQIIAATRAIYADDERAARARALATTLAPDLFGDIAQLVRDRVDPLLT
jgi:UDP:flavonoid glycosyltransferase YjiC (YdhE family)